MRVPKPRDLYFITDARRRYVKIGLSSDAERRLHDLQAGSPLTLRLDLVLEKCGRAEEESLHQAYAAHWRHREWFNYADQIKARVASARVTGAWVWDDIPPARCRYDNTFGGHLSHYEMLAALRAGTMQ